MLNVLNKYYLTSICPGVRAACLHTAGNAGETLPRSWRTDPFPSAPGRPFPHGAICRDVQSRAATSGHSQCSTLSDLQAEIDMKSVRKLPAANAINDLILDHFFSDTNVIWIKISHLYINIVFTFTLSVFCLPLTHNKSAETTR